MNEPTNMIKAIKVQYTVKENFVEANKKNIGAVMEALRGMGDVGVLYSVFLKGDGKTFIHIAQFRDAKAEDVIPNLQEFEHFRKELKQNIEAPPESEDLALVNSSSS